MLFVVPLHTGPAPGDNRRSFLAFQILLERVSLCLRDSLLSVWLFLWWLSRFIYCFTFSLELMITIVTVFILLVEQVLILISNLGFSSCRED